MKNLSVCSRSQLAYGAGAGRPFSSQAMRDYEMGLNPGHQPGLNPAAASGIDPATGLAVGSTGLAADNSRSYLGGAGSRLSGASDPTHNANGGAGAGLVAGMGGLHLNEQAVIGGHPAGQDAERNRFLASRRFVG